MTIKARAEDMPPKAEDSDDENDKKAAPDDDENDNSEALSACAEACRGAEESYKSASEAFGAAAKDLESGNDSVSSLMGAESAHASAMEAGESAAKLCSGLRGAEPAPDSDKAPPAAPPAPPKATARAVPTVQGHIETARLALIGRAVMQALGATNVETALAAIGPHLKLSAAALAGLGEKDPVRARGVLGARLTRAADADKLEQAVAKSTEAADAARREKLWETAIADGRIKLAQAFAREDAKDGGKPKRIYATWAKAQNSAYPELAAFEGWIESLPRGAYVADNPDPSTLLADVAEKKLAAGLTERDIRRMRAAGLDPDEVAAVARQQMRGATYAADENQGV